MPTHQDMDSPIPMAITLADRRISVDEEVFVIAELSANHQHDLERAFELVRAAAAAGANAVKLQTYTADTMTIDADSPLFRIGSGTVWEGERLYDLYSRATTPWEWYRPLADAAAEVGLVLFSTPFDRSAVDFLEREKTPAYKIASFELTDLALIEYAASTGKPLIISTGMATAEEISEAVDAARAGGAGGVALLRCNSAYPADPSEMDLLTIPDMSARWNVPIGLSDHTLDDVAVAVAVGLGASIVEKHLTMSRTEPGPDSSFSLEPDEFAQMVHTVRMAYRARGGVRYGPSAAERSSLAFRRSLFVIDDVRAGEQFSSENVRAIRPAGGLPPKRLNSVVGRRAAQDVPRGTPLTDELIDHES